MSLLAGLLVYVASTLTDRSRHVIIRILATSRNRCVRCSSRSRRIPFQPTPRLGQQPQHLLPIHTLIPLQLNPLLQPLDPFFPPRHLNKTLPTQHKRPRIPLYFLSLRPLLHTPLTIRATLRINPSLRPLPHQHVYVRTLHVA